VAQRGPAGLRGSVFRANRSYELVVLDRLDPRERGLVGDPRLDPNLYGALRPRPGSGLPVRPASRDLALLFLTLLEAGSLPRYLFAELGLEAERTVAKLVLDRVLEVERDGEFVAGGDAADLGSRAPELGIGRVGQLSTAALLYGEALAGLSVEALAARLYEYGRQPRSPALVSAFPDARAVGEYLGLPEHASPMQPPGPWVEATAENGEHWRLWLPVSAGARRGADPAPYKLYISPSWETLPEVLDTTFEVLASCRGVIAVKLASGLEGMLRPDKLIGYFWELGELRDAAECLASRAAGWTAHGVPFTASIALDGVLSWGQDPPPAANLGSWRQWLARRLAGYLVAARANPTSELRPWQFALERIGLDGVDTETWAPEALLWERFLGDV
jgi:hypothetical protein